MSVSRGLPTSSVALIAMALVLSGCASTTPAPAPKAGHASPSHTLAPAAGPTYTFHETAISAACYRDMEGADAATKTDVGQNPAPGNAQLLASATDCATVDEWESADRLFPAAMDEFSTKTSFVENDMQAICSQAPATAPLCVNATSLGLNN
jgi:hypothetical protein